MLRASIQLPIGIRLLVIWLIFPNGCQCSLEQFTAKMCFQSDLYLDLYGMSYVKCLDACRARENCTAVTLNRRFHHCRLHIGATTQIDCPVPGLVYSERLPWQQVGDCNCGPEHTCSEETGSCEITECSLADQIRRGSYLGNQRYVGAAVFYVCDDGFYLTEATSSSTCLATGNWSLSLMCVKDCPNAAPIGNNTNTPTVTAVTPGSTLQYACQTGYQITSSADLTLTCSVTGQWDSAPVCWLPCPNVAPTGTYTNTPTVTSTSPGSTILYACATGYQITSSADLRLICTDGQWGSAPVCWRECAATAPSGTNTVDPPVVSRLPGTVITYTCISGHTPQVAGTMSLTCSSDGSWGTPPTCVIECATTPPSGTNTVEPAVVSRSPGTVITYTCISGYIPQGGVPMSLTCSSAGSWGTPPTCVLAPCDAGWTRINGRCRIFVATSNTWWNSQTHCQSLGGNLAHIYDLQDLSDIESLITCSWGNDGCYPWTGLNDLDVEGSIDSPIGASISDGVLSQLVPYYADTEASSDCAFFDTDLSELRLFDCSDTDSSICEK